jgi:RNA polymerase sigma-70 factor (ECF subfamily)
VVKGVVDKIDEEELNLENKNINVTVLLDFVQQLPDRYRLVFNLYVLDNYSHKEIANLIKISEGTSKSNLSRARKILKEKIEIHQKSLING